MTSTQTMKPSDEAKNVDAGERPAGRCLDDPDREHGDPAGDAGLAEPALDLPGAPARRATSR